MAVSQEAVRTATGELDRTEHRLGPWQKALKLLREDTSGFHPKLLAVGFATRLLQWRTAPLARARVMAAGGFRIGEGTRLLALPKISGGPTLYKHLAIGRDCLIDADCVFDLAERITIGDRVTLGLGVMLLTSTHELDIREHRAGAIQLKPIIIGDGAKLGANATILPGVTIGEGAVVDAGAVVNKDVAPRARVGGVPAMPVAR
jgi:maltose O-acetyltransferase